MYSLIIYYLDLKIPDGLSNNAEMLFNLATVCLVILVCFVNVFSYFISIYLLEFFKESINKKYPFLNPFVNYYKKSSMVFIVIELFIGFGGLLRIIYIGFSPIFM